MCRLLNRIIAVLVIGISFSLPVFADQIDGEELVDPTRPFYLDLSGGDSEIDLLIRNVVPSSYDVSFVRVSDTSPMAVINNTQVTTGDLIGGAVVISIDRSGVMLRIEDEERYISLYDTNIKGPVKN